MRILWRALRIIAAVTLAILALSGFQAGHLWIPLILLGLAVVCARGAFSR